MSGVPRTFYKILEVDSEASLEVIEAAYRRLARRYHPDVNASQDAKSKMQELNEAYSVLRDPQQRMSYDSYLSAQADAQARRTTTSNTGSSQRQPDATPPPKPEPEPSARATQSNLYDEPSWIMATACEKCGRSDASLRFAQFPFVISIILVTFRRGDRGLFCSSCRREKMTTAKLLTLLLGWWGIPWGPIYTLGVLFNSGEGVIDAKLNADYLRYLGAYFVRVGNMLEARRAIQSSLNLQHDSELAAVAHSIFGNDLMPSQEKPKLKWVTPLLLVAFVGIILVTVLLSALPKRQSVGGAIATPGPTRVLTVTPQVGADGNGEWTTLNSKTGLIELEYPGNWLVLQDTEEAIELQGNNLSLLILLIPDNEGADIQETIDNSEKDPIFEENYNRPLRDYLEEEFEKFGGGLNSLSSPIFQKIGRYSTIFNNIEYFESGDGAAQQRRMLLYFFDCGGYVCQIIYSKSDASPMVEQQRKIAEHIIASIKIGIDAINTTVAQPVPAPASTQRAGSTNVFSGLSFCYEREFSGLTKQCSQHHSVFTGIVEKLYVSWIPSTNYKGASFLKKWYIDGHFIFDSESTNEYGFIEIDQRSSLKPGKYLVDLYVGDTLVGRGDFEIR